MIANSSTEPSGHMKSTSAEFSIPAMDCPSEESDIRRVLEPITDIESLTFQLGSKTLRVTGTGASIDAALAAIRSLGFKAELVTPMLAEQDEHSSSQDSRGEVNRLLTALFAALMAEGASLFLPHGKAATTVSILFAATAIWLAGFSTYKKGWSAIRLGRLNMNALMSVAVTGAFAIGQWPEAATVMALYGIAELIEARAADRARNAIKKLLALTPDHADVLQSDGSWQNVPAAEVLLEAVIRIRPGERVPLDGVITQGTSAVNQAPVTGESVPVDKGINDPVFAGTINESGELQVRVTAAANDTTLARIIHAVEQAQGTRAPTQKFVDQFARAYTPAVFFIATAYALITPLVSEITWIAALYRALVLLVVACPCALVISTPVTVVSALASAARRGILIKGGVYLEEARKLKAVALDKTGTVTEGKPKLIDVVIIGDKYNSDDVRADAASLATRSDHPVSKAIAVGLQSLGGSVVDFKALPGRGVQGVRGDRTLVLGNHRLIEERGQCSPELEAQLQQHESLGRTVTLLASSAGVHGMFVVADTIKATSQGAIAELKQLGVTPVMLTGDNKLTAKHIASQAGIDDARGDLLPQDKLNVIADMHTWYGLTAMVGDGINDAPALAKSDIGIAMGGAGTDTAMEAADIVIMNDDLRRIPEVIRLSRRTHVVLWQNITLALGIKAAFLGLALFNHATMWTAVFADMGASLIVVGNGLRLLRGDISK